MRKVYPETFHVVAHTVEEVAAWISAQEGRTVTVQEVRQLEAQALRKLRQVLRKRGLSRADLAPDR